MMSPEQYQKIKEVFQEALERPRNKRPAFVHDACDGDETLIAEVMELLANHSEDSLLTNEREDDSTSKTKSSEGPKSNRRIGKHMDTIFSKRSIWLERFFGTRTRFGVTLIITFILLIVLGYWSHTQVKNSLEEIRAEELQTVLEADVLALEIWINDYRNSVKSWSRTPELSDEIEYILNYGNCPTCIEELQFAPWQDTITAILRPFLEDSRSAGYNVFDTDGYVFSANKRSVIGNRLNQVGFRELVAFGEAGGSFRAPFDPAQIVYEDERVKSIYDRPIVWAGNPLYNDSAQLIGYFGVGRYADEGFSDIISIAEVGKTGETYAFNRNGLMLTQSRFAEQLQTLGILPEGNNPKSALQVSLRDPGGNLLEGYKPDGPRGSQPFTRPVALALASIEDTSVATRAVITEPYRDYRGVTVIGAYHWFPEYNFGLVTEVDYEEAFSPLVYIDNTFLVLILILALVITYSLYSSLRFLGLKRKVGEAVQLGQYTLVRKIGEGGIGEVYLADHALLKRPTAIKILKADHVSSEVIERFEREVQLASRLTHPNTIEIYDFGSTDEGVFYYAMELLNGFTLAQVIQMQGEMPVARVLHILRQATASIAEAHSIDLIHRDIKPQNIMLVQRGGEHDVVKVLDFGLVKDLTADEAEQTRTTQLTGTPLYMAPERIKSPTTSDKRSDLYALGAVAYYLLAGEALFRYSSEIDIMYQVVNTDPEPLHKVNKDVPKDVSAFVQSLLAKDPDERPQSAKEMLQALTKLMTKHNWTEEDAEKWWARFK
ncbi:MAG: serine/threonine protein kinase [Flavobacteriia bacterium]|nr:serine/threonine protein kinase [Flavobacteriia bacterium]